MAAPIIAGILTGCGLYYLSRVGPRIAARVAATERLRTQQNLSEFLQHRTQPLLPYHKFEQPFRRVMTEEEAMLLLGFSEAQTTGSFVARPSPAEVKQRYREMMKDFHSDVAGSALLATKINEARDVLSK